MDLKDKVLKHLSNNANGNNKLDVVMNSIFKEFKATAVVKQQIYTVFKRLEKEGKISVKNNRVYVAKTQNNQNESRTVLTGKFTKLGKHGLISAKENGVATSYFVPEKFIGNTPNESTVTFVKISQNGEEVAQVKDILSIKSNLLFGKVELVNNVPTFIPNNSKFENSVVLQQNEFAKRAVGKIVNVKLNEQQVLSGASKITATIDSDEQIYGFIENPMGNIQAVLDENNIKVDFPDHVNAELSDIPNEVLPHELEGRLDLRDKNFISIDPATAKDLDDAVCVEEIKSKEGYVTGYNIYVAIADVSHYVKPGTAIDREAYRRGTSVYPAGTVAPMLPPALSNGVCSLHPNVDRLAVVTKIRISKQGEIEAYSFNKAVINNKKKFSYEQVSALHHNDTDALKEFSEYKDTVEALYNITKILEKQSKREGRLNISGYEPTVVLTPQKDDVLDFRNDNDVDSHKVIEHMMVLNNRVTAQFLTGLGIKHVLRGHDAPVQSKMQSLVAKLSEFGIDMNESATSRNFQNTLSLVDDHPYKKIIHTLIVRSMRKASYTSDNTVGHFGLGTDLYSHFTSPIRRYPDIMEHRTLFKALELYNAVIKENNLDTSQKDTSDLLTKVKQLGKDKFSGLVDTEFLSRALVQVNERESVAKEVSQVTDKICSVIYMSKQIGSIKKGYISYVDETGVIVTLSDPNDPLHSEIIDVFVPTQELTKSQNTYTDKTNSYLINATTGRTVASIGKEVSVKIMSTDITNQLITATTDLQKEVKQTTSQEQELAR